MVTWIFSSIFNCFSLQFRLDLDGIHPSSNISTIDGFIWSTNHQDQCDFQIMTLYIPDIRILGGARNLKPISITRLSVSPPSVCFCHFCQSVLPDWRDCGKIQNLYKALLVPLVVLVVAFGTSNHTV